MTKRNLIIIGTIVLVLIFWRTLAAKNGIVEVETQTVERKTLIESLSASGEVMAEKYASMYLPTGGKIAAISVAEGQVVKKGQGLISLDKTLLDTAYQQARAQLRKYEATVDYVHDQVKNHDKDETYLQKDTRTTAEANKDYYYDAFRAAEYNLKNATLTAPFDGVVTSFSEGLAVGANVLVTSPVFAVIDPSTTYLETEVGESDVVKIKLNQKVIVELDAYPEETFDAEVTMIDFASVLTSSGGKAYKVKVTLPENSDLKFKLGMSGDARFVTNQKDDVLLASQGAVIEENGKSYVWIVTNGQATQKEVVTGGSSIDDIEITSGLSGGEVIIVNPPTKVKEGSKVK